MIYVSELEKKFIENSLEYNWIKKSNMYKDIKKIYADSLK